MDTSWSPIISLVYSCTCRYHGSSLDPTPSLNPSFRRHKISEGMYAPSSKALLSRNFSIVFLGCLSSPGIWSASSITFLSRKGTRNSNPWHETVLSERNTSKNCNSSTRRRDSFSSSSRRRCVVKIKIPAEQFVGTFPGK